MLMFRCEELSPSLFYLKENLANFGASNASDNRFGFLSWILTRKNRFQSFKGAEL